MDKTYKDPRKQIGHDLSKLTYNRYFPSIPLSDIFAIIEKSGGLPVDESGQKWYGFLCGEIGHCIIDIQGIKTTGLSLTWYRLESGNYEITAYLM